MVINLAFWPLHFVLTVVVVLTSHKCLQHTATAAAAAALIDPSRGAAD